MQVTSTVGEPLLLAYRDLVGAEARLGESLARRGVRVGTSVTTQWSTLHEYLHIYGRGLSPAGLLVLGGRPDGGSRLTGIPFTGAVEARERMGLQVEGDERSPSGDAFWRAVDETLASSGDAPLESLLGSVHLAHALPFDYPPLPEVRDAGGAHVLRLLVETRPQAVVAVGADALSTLARALRHEDLDELSRADEATWLARWPAGSRLGAYPYAEVSAKRPFRVRIVPVPSLAGSSSRETRVALRSLFSYVL
jgi:uracil-DNA glycosylase